MIFEWEDRGEAHRETTVGDITGTVRRSGDGIYTGTVILTYDCGDGREARLILAERDFFISPEARKFCEKIISVMTGDTRDHRIDDVIPKRGRGRPATFGTSMTAAERQRARRDRVKSQKPGNNVTDNGPVTE